MTNALALPKTSALLESAGWADDILIEICLALQLTATQYGTAENHYHAVARWLAADGSPLSGIDQDVFPQGSLRIGTTVRPRSRDEYDLDLVLHLKLPEVDPVFLLNLVEQRLRAHGTYAPMVERKNRCIRLNFAQQFHLDILPARADLRLGGTHVLVPDRSARCWKESNPKGYAQWFEGRGALMQTVALAEKRAPSIETLPLPQEIADKNALQLAVQLMKRWRDIRFADRADLAPISILLTTLAGQFYSGERQPLEALCNIVSAINRSIPPHGRLKVCNPANPLEDLSERWESEREAYRLFIHSMRELKTQLEELGAAVGIPSIGNKLKALFGEEVTKNAERRRAGAIEEVRRSGLLGVTASGGLTVGASSRVASIRSNTFYGS